MELICMYDEAINIAPWIVSSRLTTYQQSIIENLKKGLSVDKIAEILGRTKGTINTAICRIKKELRFAIRIGQAEKEPLNGSNTGDGDEKEQIIITEIAKAAKEYKGHMTKNQIKKIAAGQMDRKTQYRICEKMKIKRKVFANEASLQIEIARDRFNKNSTIEALSREVAGRALGVCGPLLSFKKNIESLRQLQCRDEIFVLVEKGQVAELQSKMDAAHIKAKKVFDIQDDKSRVYIFSESDASRINLKKGGGKQLGGFSEHYKQWQLRIKQWGETWKGKSQIM